MKIVFLAVILCILAACRGVYEPDTNEETEKLMYSLRMVVDNRFNPPLCFLANNHFGYQGGPVLTQIPCANAENWKNKVVIGCESCWNE